MTLHASNRKVNVLRLCNVFCVMWTAIYLYAITANLRGDMIECYHHQCDNLEVMLTDDNIQFLGKTADALTSTLHKMSEPTDCK